MSRKIIISYIFAFLFLHTIKPVHISDSDYFKKQPHLKYINRLAWVESNNNPKTKDSEKGAIGRLQITKDGLGYHNDFCKCGNDYKLSDLRNDKINWHVGTYYLEIC